MKRIIIIIAFLSQQLLFAGQPSDSLNSEIQLHTYLQETEVPLNGEVVYHVELSWVGELNRYNIFEVGEPVASNLKIHSSGSSNKIFTDDQGKMHALKRISFHFTPLEMGMAYIDGITIQYEDKIRGDKEALMAQRLGAKIIGPLPEPGAGIQAGEFALILLIIIACVVLTFFLYRYFSRRSQDDKDTEIKLTLEERYLELLQRSVDPAQNKTAQNTSALSKLLNRYLGEKFNLIISSSFKEAESTLREAQVDADIIEKIKRFYELSEKSKFAAEEISGADLHLFYDTVELLLKRLNELPGVNES